MIGVCSFDDELERLAGEAHMGRRRLVLRDSQLQGACARQARSTTTTMMTKMAMK